MQILTVKRFHEVTVRVTKEQNSSRACCFLHWSSF